MEADVDWGKQTLIKMLLYNVMSGVSEAARLNIALGQRCWIRVRSEQSLSAKRRQGCGLEYSHLASGTNLIQLKLLEWRAAEGEKSEEMKP